MSRPKAKQHKAIRQSEPDHCEVGGVKIQPEELLELQERFRKDLDEVALFLGKLESEPKALAFFSASMYRLTFDSFVRAGIELPPGISLIEPPAIH
jgi:hypothetical protein